MSTWQMVFKDGRQRRSCSFWWTLHWPRHLRERGRVRPCLGSGKQVGPLPSPAKALGGRGAPSQMLREAGGRQNEAQEARPSGRHCPPTAS